jgi:hypothetical protein
MGTAETSISKKNDDSGENQATFVITNDYNNIFNNIIIIIAYNEIHALLKSLIKFLVVFFPYI